MKTAYVLISCDPEDIEEIITMLNSISNISEANRVEGLGSEPKAQLCGLFLYLV